MARFLDFSSTTMFLYITYPFYLIIGDIAVRDSSVGNLVAESVNGVDLAYFLSESVARAASVKITGAKHFDKLHVTSLESLGVISGVDVNELYRKAIVTTGKSHQAFAGESDKQITVEKSFVIVYLPRRTRDFI